MELLAGCGERRDRTSDAHIQRFWNLDTCACSARNHHLVYELLQSRASVSARQHRHVDSHLFAGRSATRGRTRDEPRNHGWRAYVQVARRRFGRVIVKARISLTIVAPRVGALAPT
jgi:hypothetical protein